MSLASRVRTAAGLPLEEVALALRATTGLLVARAAIAALGAPRVVAWAEATRPRRTRRAGYAAGVRRAMARAARTVPESGCLTRAIVAVRLLRLGGADAKLVFGVQSGAGPLAHAWVLSGGLIVTGDEEAARYTSLTEAPAGP